MWVTIPDCLNIPPSLLDPPVCDPAKHTRQTFNDVLVIRDSATFQSMKDDLKGPFFFVHHIANRNPRFLTYTNSVIAFKSPSSKVVAVFPQETPADLIEEIFTHFSHFPLLTRTVKLFRAISANYRVKNLRASGLGELIAGKNIINSNQAFSRHVWGIEFCPVSKEESMSWPLTCSQEYHLAYFMDMMAAFGQAIGFPNLADKKCR